MADVLAFDEINQLYDDAEEAIDIAVRTGNTDGLTDYVEDLLISAYVKGRKYTYEELDEFLEDEYDYDKEDLIRSLNKRYDGKDFRDRINEYVDADNAKANITRVAHTEIHRMANDGTMSAAKKIQKDTKTTVTKTWNTMLDNRVRETHRPLEGITIGIDDYFVTFDGDRALVPGGFNNVENNASCRCLLKFSKK